jgi:hypothetical protein
MRFKLISKINILAVALILLTSIGIATYAVWRENRHMIAALKAHSESLSFLIAESCEYGVYTQDVKYLERILGSVSTDQKTKSGKIPGSLSHISPVADWKFTNLKIVEKRQKCLKSGES